MLQASRIQETRPRARELKFLATLDMADRVETRARARLARDPYGSGESGDAYRTTSLYFDTPAFDVLHRKGSFGIPGIGSCSKLSTRWVIRAAGQVCPPCRTKGSGS